MGEDCTTVECRRPNVAGEDMFPSPDNILLTTCTTSAESVPNRDPSSLTAPNLVEPALHPHLVGDLD